MEELDVYGDVPMARFGHTITLVSKTKVVLFGGATGDTGKYSMTGETYLFNILTKTWSKLNGNFKCHTNTLYSKGRTPVTQSCSLIDECGADADGRLWWCDWRRLTRQ